VEREGGRRPSTASQTPERGVEDERRERHAEEDEDDVLRLRRLGIDGLRFGGVLADFVDGEPPRRLVVVAFVVGQRTQGCR
jgi:hypothetical protein